MTLRYKDMNGVVCELNTSFEVTKRNAQGYPTEVHCFGCEELFEGKIAMIKHLRKQWSLGLKEAKDAYESLDPVVQTYATVSPNYSALVNENEALREQIDRLNDDARWDKNDLDGYRKTLNTLGTFARIYREAVKNNLEATKAEVLEKLLSDLEWR